MSANVVALKPKVPEAVPEVVAFLEKLLEEAKAGEIRSFAYAAAKIGSETGTGWVMDPNGSDTHVLCSAIATVQHRFMTNLCEHSTPAE
jgi:hypothetical protein